MKMFEKLNPIKYLKDENQMLKNVIKMKNEEIERKNTTLDEMVDKFALNRTRLKIKEEDYEQLSEQYENLLAEVKQYEVVYDKERADNRTKIRQLELWAEKRDDRHGVFMVFNPEKDKPRVIHTDYDSAFREAKRISNLCDGKEILILKIVTSVQIQDIIKDFSQDDKLPF